jgi:hypothetical protein
MNDLPIVTIHLWPRVVPCAMCPAEGDHRHAVGWYCGPVEQDPGQRVPGWGPDAVAGGMTVCRECHDTFYGIEPPAPPDPRQLALFAEECRP